MLVYAHDASGNTDRRTTLGTLLPPQITGQPVKQVAEPGNIVTFSVVVADARAVTFQWQRNGADIDRATGDSLLLTNVSAANEGQYSVVVTNSAGSITSNSAALLLDSDRDGLPDSWEIAHFGNTTSQRSAGDPDGDGISNLDEFLDGTDPTYKGSLRPRLTAYSGAGGSVAVTPMKLSYAFGESVTLTPFPFPPSVFVGWAGDLNGTGNPATLTMDRNKTVRARFASAVPLPPGLIALWRGETDASDLIGGHHGTFFAGTAVTAPSVTASGKVGGAFNFDGTVHVRVPDSAALKPAQLTAEAWVFPTAAPNNSPQTIIARGFFGNTWDLRLTNNMPEFWSHGGQGLEGPSAIPLNEWTHLAISFDGTTKRLYVNGAQVASREQLDALLYDAAAVPMTIGSDFESNKSGNHFNGRIDEVALYNRALTADEVLSISNADFLGKNFSQPYFTSPSQWPDGVLEANYTQQLTTILGTPPVSFSLSEGLLPPGMTLSSAGLVSGVPSASGTFGFTARATDAAGISTEQLCALRVL
jgi:concanavalin A-like lectin/glucanase superfamily protein/Ig-like domain-containing protein/putative Ig domain-containing protein/List-Bact-rpt repeat protein